ncbi:MAG: IS5/IS1182 family transposase, partial [Candidatus Thiodiazotropha sp. (ex Lucinoma kastoroae)]|nr:IS5/IS1182 family transposase [Candidatus Thiodiazotropha sp. (ex Lucinoma kastoroae)]
VHTALIETYLGNQLIGHISRDSTAIEAREKPEKKVEETPPPKKRDRPQKGEERIKEPTRLERQSEGMTLTEMKDKLPNHLQCWHETQQQGIQDELDRLQASY